MRPVRLELSNFLAYRTPVVISFDGLDIACLSGPNGAGKSTLLDAITWALWGESRKTTNVSDEVLIHIGQHEMYVTLDFRQDGQLFRVRREFKRGKSNQSALHFYYWDVKLNQFVPRVESIRETQDNITRLLRLDCETFINSAFVRQNQADSFTVKTPKQRKDLLATILGLTRWEGYEKQAKAESDKRQTQLDVLDTEIARIAQEEAAEPGLRAELAAAEQARLDASQQADAAQERYQEVASAPDQRRAAEAQMTELQRRTKQLRIELEQAQLAITRQEKRLAGFRAILARQGEIEADYARLQAARHADSEQSERLQRLRELEKKRDKVQRELDTERHKIESQLRVHADRIRKEEQAILARPALEAKAEALAAQIEEFRALDHERAQRQQHGKQLHGQAEALESTNRALREQMNDIKKRQDAIIGMEICTLCGQPIDDQHRAHFNEQLMAEGKPLGDQYRANRTTIADLREQEKANERELARVEATLKSADKVKADVARLQEQLAALDQSDEQLEGERQHATTLEAQLAAEAFGQGLREQIRELNAQIATTGYDDDLHTESRDLLRRLAAADGQMSELKTAIESADDAEADLAQRQTFVEQKAAQIREELAREADQAAEIERLMQLVLEAERRHEEWRRLQKLEARATERKIGAEQKLKAIEVSRERKRNLEQQYEVLQEEIGLFDDLREAFGKNGIPAMIIESAIPELEESTNRLLNRMTDGRMAIRFDTQRTNKSGTTIETLDILISDELGQRSYDLFSGGEGFRINFALRVALSQFLARRAGARLQTLIIDEGFGSQDAVGRERIVEAINAIKGDFELVLIVTHIDELLDLFPARIEVRKTATGSVATVK